jgi:beta-lactamase superfamily II metal-dependent hydrolase
MAMLVLLCSLIWLVGCAPLQNDPSASVDATSLLTVHVLDVGQADSILISFPSGQNLLIDGGNNGDGRRIIDYLHAQGVDRLDFIIGTHPHADHIGGLDEVIKTIPVEAVYLPLVTQNTNSYLDLLESIQDAGLTVTKAATGVTLPITGGVTATMLGPIQNDYQELNDWSVVLRVTFDQVSLLFTGDAGAAAEADLLASGQDLQAQLLKVGHHGSSTSSSAELLAAVQPRYAVISVGQDNDYGHPSQNTLRRLRNAGATVYRTATSGTVLLESDGKSVQVVGDASQQTVLIWNIDRQAEVVTLQNMSDAAVDLSGWTLISEVGNQRFTLPAGTKLAPQATLQIVSGPDAQAGPSRLVWSTEHIWNNSGDPGDLLDAHGHQVSRYAGGR